jgi:hypothetical protein
VLVEHLGQALLELFEAGVDALGPDRSNGFETSNDVRIVTAAAPAHRGI